MFIANDSNYTFGQFLDVVNGADIKAPVYTKCFTDTEALKGYRFVHDPEETDPEICVCFSIYDDVSSEATSTAFGKDAVVSDLTSVSFRLDTKILDSGKVRDVPYYHVIIPVVNIMDDTLKYLVIKMTKEVELFPEDYPYYELADTFADAQPTSADAPGGGVTPTGTLEITENGTYDVTDYASAAVNVAGGSSDFSIATVTLNFDADAPANVTGNLSYLMNVPDIGDTILNTNTWPRSASIQVPLYKNKSLLMYDTDVSNFTFLETDPVVKPAPGVLIISGDCTLTIYGLST